MLAAAAAVGYFTVENQLNSNATCSSQQSACFCFFPSAKRPTANSHSQRHPFFFFLSSFLPFFPLFIYFYLNLIHDWKKKLKYPFGGLKLFFSFSSSPFLLFLRSFQCGGGGGEKKIYDGHDFHMPVNVLCRRPARCIMSSKHLQYIEREESEEWVEELVARPDLFWLLLDDSNEGYCAFAILLENCFLLLLLLLNIKIYAVGLWYHQRQADRQTGR